MLTAGVDEVGRGPLAGPVVAAAVILKLDEKIEELNDSKKLSPPKRENLVDAIKSNSISWSIGISSQMEIDSINILQASLLAMKRAVEGLKIVPELVLIDGNNTPDLDIQTRTIIKGDQTERCIMAASIYAKVSRDKLMENYALQYPNFGFENNKGYGTKFHLNALKNHNPSPIHRLSFKPMKNKKSRIL